MLLFYQIATRLSLTTCWQVVQLQDDNKLLEQLVTSLLSSTTLQQVVNKPLTTCQQAGNKQCEHILLTSCWNSIATSLLQVCYNLCVFTCVVSSLPTKARSVMKSPRYWPNIPTVINVIMRERASDWYGCNSYLKTQGEVWSSPCIFPVVASL
jgi:hypothetical protein